MTDQEVVTLVVERLDDQDRKLDQILGQVKATNGRVTSIEARHIAEDAVHAERARRAREDGEHGDEVSTNRSRRVDRLVAATVGIGGVVIGAVLSDTHPFG